MNRSIICRDAIIADYNQKRCRKRFWQKCGHVTFSHYWRPIFLTVLLLTLPSPPLPINYQYHYQCHCFHFDHNHIMIVLLDSAWSSPLNQGGRFRPQLCCRLLAATREACGTSYPGATYYLWFTSSLFFFAWPLFGSYQNIHIGSSTIILLCPPHISFCPNKRDTEI